MQIRITLDTDNAAFEDNPREVPRAVEKALYRLALDSDDFTKPAEVRVMDANGNAVGTATTEREANAHLIAAAPELLTALQAAKAFAMNWHRIADNAATEERGLGADATTTLRFNLGELFANLRAAIAKATE